MRKIFKSYTFNILLMVSLTALILYITLKDDYKSVIKLISNLNVFWIIGLFAYVIFYQCVIGYILYILTKSTEKSYKLRYGIINALIATFFHEIVPGASGGQFMQVYVFRKHGVDIGKSAGILWIDFIVFQATMVLTVFILIVSRIKEIYQSNFNLFVLVIVGFIVNAAIIVGMWLITKFSSVYRWVSTKGVKIAKKLRFIKDEEKAIIEMDRTIAKFEKELGKLKNNKPLLVKAVLVNIFRLLLYYFFPFVCAKALNINMGSEHILEVITLTAMVASTASLFIVPGASGGTELMFFALFSLFMTSVEAKSVMLLWRLFSYYVILLVSGIVFFVFKQYYIWKER